MLLWPTPGLKGNRSQDTSWLEIAEIGTLLSEDFISLFHQYLFTGNTLCFKSELNVQPCWIALYWWRAEKGCLAAYSVTLYDIIYDMTAGDTVYDITASDTDCWAQNSTSHSQISPPTFKHWFNRTRYWMDQILNGKLLCPFSLFFHSYLLQIIMLFCSASPLIKRTDIW